MPEPTSIVAMIAVIKHSIDVVKAVKDADYDLDKAILKEKIAILVDSLLEAKIQAVEIQEVIQEKDKKIKELEDLLKFKANLVRKNGMYYKSDENEYPTKEPFCSNCWDVKQMKIHLTQLQELFFSCPNCKNEFGTYKVYI